MPYTDTVTVQGGAREGPAILIGFTEISGYFHNLAEGLNELGYRCDFVELVPHPFGYREDVSGNGMVVSLIKALKRLGSRSRSSVLQRTLALFAGLLMVPFFLVALVKYDAFLFTYGNSFFSGNRDLVLLKLLGKRIVMPFLGSEVRPRYIDGFLEFSDADEMYESTRHQREKMRVIERSVDVIVNNPAAGHLLDRPFVNFFCLGIPHDRGGTPVPEPTTTPPDGHAPGPSPPGGDCIRILHTPSVRTGKGSDLIRAIVSRLGEKYHIEYTEITGRPHSEVLEAIRTSDLVIDQAFSDTPMAAFASEAAWSGVPAVVGGYYSTVIGDEVEDEFIPPSRYVLPEDLESAVESLIVDAVARHDLGERAKRFVRTRWSPAEVASRYARIIRGDIPEEWWIDPCRTTYVYGCGLSRDQAIARISAIIDSRGPEALGLGEKRALQQRFADLANRRSSAAPWREEGLGGPEMMPDLGRGA